MGKLLGQTSLEFLFATGLMVLMLVIVVVLYYQSQVDAVALSSYAESQRICNEIAMQLSAVDSTGDGASAVLKMPSSLYSRAYAVFVSGQNRSVAVSYGGQGTGCFLSTTNISKGSASSFYIANDTLIRNVGGGVLVG